MKKHLINALKLCVAVGILWYLVSSGKLNFSQLPEALKHWHWLVVSFGCLFVQIALVTLRWKCLLRGVGVKEKFFNLMSFTWIGQLFNNVMLGSVGGDVIKIFYVVRHFPTKKAVTGMTVLLDRVIGLYCMILLVFVSLFLAPESVLEIPAIKALRMGIVVFIGASVVLGPLVFSRRIRSKLPLKGILSELADALVNYRHAKRYIFSALILSVLCHLGAVVNFYALSRALANNVEILDFATMLFVVPAGLITLAIPVAPAGLGVGQVAFAQLFEWVGATIPTLGANTATLFQINMMAFNLLGIFAYISHKPKKKQVTAVEAQKVSYEAL